MKTFKIKNESDLKKIEVRNIEPINIVKTDTGWDVEVEEDVDIEGILVPVPEPEKKKDSSKKDKKDKEKK